MKDLTKKVTQRGINARAWMASLSTAGRHTEPAAKPEQPKTLVVERWDGAKWIEIEMAWNGERYVEVSR